MTFHEKLRDIYYARDSWEVERKAAIRWARKQYRREHPGLRLRLYRAVALVRPSTATVDATSATSSERRSANLQGGG